MCVKRLWDWWIGSRCGYMPSLPAIASVLIIIAYNHITCLQASKDFIDVFLQMFNSSKHQQAWHIESHCALLIERLLIDKKPVLWTEQVLGVVVYQKGHKEPLVKNKLSSHSLIMKLWPWKRLIKFLSLVRNYLDFCFLKLYIIASFSPLSLQHLPCMPLAPSLSFSFSLSNSWPLFDFYIYIKIYIYVLFVSLYNTYII